MRRNRKNVSAVRLNANMGLVNQQKNQNRRNIRRIVCIVSVVLFLLPMVALGFTSLVDKDPTVSVEEKRNLKTRPEFTFTALFNGSYTKDFEEYYADTFPLRSFFLGVNDKVKKVLTQTGGKGGMVIVESDGGEGSGEALHPEKGEQQTSSPAEDTVTDNNATVPNLDNNDFEKDMKHYTIIDGTRKAAMEMYDMNKKQISGYMDAVNRLAKKVPNSNVYVMLAPTSMEFYGPSEYRTGSKSQKSGIDYAYSLASAGNLKTVDAYTPLGQHTDEYIFFRTDHHWTARGAYYGYTGLAKAAGFAPTPLNAFTPGKIDGFVGTLYSYTKSSVLQNNPDYVEYFPLLHPAEGKIYSGSSMENGRDMTIVATEVNNPNKYLAFIEGDNPLTKITTSQKNGRRIIVIKESYGNALVPFLTENYEEIYVIDPRKLPNMNLPEFVKAHSIQDVLVINYTKIPGNKTYMNALNNVIGA